MMTQKASLNIEMPGVDFAGMAREAIAAKLPGSDRQATEAEADSAIKCLRLAIDAAENSNQAGENAVVKAASAIGWRRA